MSQKLSGHKCGQNFYYRDGTLGEKISVNMGNGNCKAICRDGGRREWQEASDKRREREAVETTAVWEPAKLLCVFHGSFIIKANY